MLDSENHAESCFSFHHASIGVGRLFKRHGFDHGPNVLENTEFKGVLIIDRFAG